MRLGSILAVLALATGAVAQFYPLGMRMKTGDKTNPSVDFKNSPTLNPKSGLTIEAWITYDDSDLPDGIVKPTLLCAGATKKTSAFLMHVDAGANKARHFRFHVNSAFRGMTCTFSFAAGRLKKWTHVAGTWDTVTARLFIDGAQVSSMSNGAPSVMGLGGSLRLGNGDKTVSGSHVWNGEIDEVRLWPFARTAAEIRSTMFMALSGVPGQVSTWNLDFHARDSSGGNDGTMSGLPFAGNTLKLTAVSDIGGKPFGRATPGCAKPVAGVTAYANRGNGAFGLTCVGGASSVGGGRGFLWLGLDRLSTPVLVHNVEIWVDLSRPGVLVGVVPSVYGYCRIPLPIPATVPVGTKVHTQFAWTGGCAQPLYTTSGFTITVQQ